MKIQIEIEDGTSEETIALLQTLLQAKADDAMDAVFGASVSSEVFRLMRQHKEFMGQSTEHMLTDNERLAWQFGVKPSSASSDFAFSFGS